MASLVYSCTTRGNKTFLPFFSPKRRKIIQINPRHFRAEYGQKTCKYIFAVGKLPPPPPQTFSPFCVTSLLVRPQFRKALGVTLFWWDSTPGKPADMPGEKAGMELFLRESDSRLCGEPLLDRPPNAGAPCWRCGGG